MQFLIALDLEGIHGVEGERYKSLGGDNPWYSVAKENAVKEQPPLRFGITTVEVETLIFLRLIKGLRK